VLCPVSAFTPDVSFVADGGFRTKGPGDKQPSPNEAQIATAATEQAACRTSAWWTRPRLPGLLARAEIGSYRPGLGLCDRVPGPPTSRL